MAEVENSFSGNICRCTGYRPILSAFKSLCCDASAELLGKCPDIEDLRGRCGNCRHRQGSSITEQRTEALRFNLGNSTWIKVFTLDSLYSMLKKYVNLDYMLISGNTARGVHPFVPEPQVYLDITDVAELATQQLYNETLMLGANTTLANAIKVFHETAKNDKKFAYLTKIAHHISLIANTPVRNVSIIKPMLLLLKYYFYMQIGTLAGNLMMKYRFNDFPSDIFVVLEAAGATLSIGKL